MSENIAQPADAARLPKSGRTPHAHLEIAHQRFPADQEFVGKREPRADDKPSFRDQPTEESFLFRTNFQVILHRDELAIHLVEGKKSRFQFLQDQVEHPHELGAKMLKRQIPFAIPMGAKNQMDLRRWRQRFFHASRRFRQPTICVCIEG